MRSASWSKRACALRSSMRFRQQWSGRKSSPPAIRDARSIAAWRGKGGTGRCPHSFYSRHASRSDACREACVREEGGAWGKHGFPHATERPPMAVAEEGSNGAVERARRRRFVSDDVELIVIEDAGAVATAIAERLSRAAR